MKCVVINGTEIKGCTYNLKEIFIDELKPDELIEFYLPKDGPNFCIGCKRCFTESENKCPHFDKVNPIWKAMVEADLIVFAYPVYVLRAPGQIKALLDHLGVHWFVHRPEPLMFNKSAVIITQSIGAPNKSAQKDVRTSLEWLGVSKIRMIGFSMMEGIIWNEISQDRRNKFDIKMRSFAKKFQNLKLEKKSLKSKLYFKISKKLQENTLKKLPVGENPPADLQYWIDNGWIIKKDNS